MDQYTAAMGRAGHALMIDCRELTHRAVPLPPGSQLTVVDPGVGRDLAAEEYARRRTEVETAVGVLRRVAGPIESLRDLSPAEFEEVEDILPQPLRDRARHVVEAIARVPAGVTHLALGEPEAFGRLMNACHVSLATLFEVSLPELDRIVSAANGVEGVWGARLTGAGFGGCVVVLHPETVVEALTDGVRKAFGDAGDAEGAQRLRFHHLRTADGARLLDVAPGDGERLLDAAASDGAQTGEGTDGV